MIAPGKHLETDFSSGVKIRNPGAKTPGCGFSLSARVMHPPPPLWILIRDGFGGHFDHRSSGLKVATIQHKSKREGFKVINQEIYHNESAVNFPLSCKTATTKCFRRNVLLGSALPTTLAQGCPPAPTHSNQVPGATPGGWPPLSSSVDRSAQLTLSARKETGPTELSVLLQVHFLCEND